MVTHAAASVPKTAKCPCVANKVNCRKSRRSVADAGTSSALMRMRLKGRQGPRPDQTRTPSLEHSGGRLGTEEVDVSDRKQAGEVLWHARGRNGWMVLAGNQAAALHSPKLSADGVEEHSKHCCGAKCIFLEKGLRCRRSKHDAAYTACHKVNNWCRSQ